MKTASTQQKNDNLPRDLQLEIKLRLPVKSLFRFKSVSKSWGNLISGPSFRDMHHKQSKKKNPNLLFYINSLHPRANPRDEWSAEWSSLDIKSLSLGNGFATRCKVFNMLVTSRGALCFLGTKDGSETQVFLYFIGTKELLALPIDSSSKFSKGPIVGFGIGYIPSTERYKVSLLFMKCNQNIHPCPRYHCQVIEISNGSGDGSRRSYSNWRMVEEELPYLVDCFHSPALVEDTIYWKAWSKDLIISFNVKDEKFGTINCPDRDHRSVANSMHLVDLQGKLGLAVASTVQACFTVVIWKLQDHGGCIWEKGYTLNLGEIKPNCWELMKSIYLQDEEIIMYSEGCLRFYNLERNTCKVLDIDVPLNYAPIGMYHESLFSVGTT